MKVMSAKEFVKKGYLQEVNRRFFHPLGLAITVEKDREKDDECFYKFFSVIDSRDDPEGYAFDIASMPEELEKMKERADFIDAELEKKREKRVKEFGDIIQPLKNHD